MNVTCIVCGTPHKVADLSFSYSVTQAVCKNCSANLVFIKQPLTEDVATADEPVSSGATVKLEAEPESETAESQKRARVLGVSTSIMFCLLAYAVVGSQSHSTYILIQQTATGQKVRGATEEVDPSTPSLEAGRQAFEQNEFRKALGHFRTAVAQAPSSIPAHISRGEAARTIGELDEALEAYRTAVQLNPSSENYFHLGMMAHRIGETKLAIESLNASLASRQFFEKVHDSFFGFRLNGVNLEDYLFEVLVESGERAAALDFARARGWVREDVFTCPPLLSDELPNGTLALVGMLTHPESTPCLIEQGVILTNNGFVRLARLVLVEVTRTSPYGSVRQAAEAFLRHHLPPHDVAKRAEWYTIVGNRLLTKFKKSDDAIEVYQKAIAADPSFPWPYCYLGEAYAVRKEFAQALEWYRKAVEIDPDFWRAQLDLGWVNLRLELYKEALVPLRLAVAFEPQNPNGHVYLGRVLLELGQEDEGIKELQTAIKLDPRSREIPEFPEDKL